MVKKRRRGEEHCRCCPPEPRFSEELSAFCSREGRVGHVLMFFQCGVTL